MFVYQDLSLHYFNHWEYKWSKEEGLSQIKQVEVFDLNMAP